MLDRTAHLPVDQIASAVGYILSKHGVEGPVAADAVLPELGLTSIDMVELMLAVEAEFDLTIPPVDITLANFSSIRAIDALVAKLTLSR